MKILFKRLIPEAIIPTRADDGSAGWDLYVPSYPEAEYIVPAHGRVLVKLGFATEIVEPEMISHFLLDQHNNTYSKFFCDTLQQLLPAGYQVEIRPRSGNALKRGLTVLNTPGTIDSSYRGEWGVILYNTTDYDIEIHPTDKIAQAVLMPYYHQEYIEVDELSDSKRGTGGFGSSDKK